eukprot:CAMPEP_0115489914 /NCGR_PEP_ID=MMETSP0271-20121206/62273_1 /TAXON_ID=71861 /ORGANISM="Scrippsiella trochoidea, Strain CCMP3099" /LENGTH=47 /DNA_ID= /DNA_START= /DNA_END= /DNA_ORIENTATION=
MGEGALSQEMGGSASIFWPSAVKEAGDSSAGSSASCRFAGFSIFPEP